MSLPVAPSVYRDRLGTGTLLWTWEGEISEALSARVLRVYRCWKEDPLLAATGVWDVVPAYTSVAIHFDPVAGNAQRIAARAETLLREMEAGTSPMRKHSEAIEIAVCYNGEDLSRVAKYCGISVAEVIRRHTAVRYTIAMIGFRPHFPYLIGMDTSLTMPRLDTPRTAVPAGSVGIAGMQTGVYPVTSPGGWNIIGSCDAESLTHLRPGDCLVFRRVSCE
jgi:KipI family sensor histidine kinase inhibitor